MYTDHEIGPEEHELWFQHIREDPTCRYWVIVSDDEDVGLVGLTGIDHQNRRCFWTWHLASPSVRGKGVGSFVEYSILRHVFDEMGLNKLCCEVFTFNETVTNMHMGFGFRQEGTFREHIWKDDRPHDIVCLAILRTEWESLKPEIERRLRNKGLL
jgi:UDP-4-amino-4,6-dideoxy-N-acetyl-beta-L-altrosamine N-acetyltransferase